MPKKKAAVPTKSNQKGFDTSVVVALYLCKPNHVDRESDLNLIGTILTGNNDFSYKNPDHRNKVNVVLAQKFPWLPSLEYNREGYKKWMDNIKKNHGENLIIEL